MEETKEYTFRQLGTKDIRTVIAPTQAEAKTQAAREFHCRESSCLYMDGSGKVRQFTLKNWTTKEKHRIKADDFDSARLEMAAATDTDPKEWIWRAEEVVDDSTKRDIEYITFESSCT